jgi:hypothetical protein
MTEAISKVEAVAPKAAPKAAEFPMHLVGLFEAGSTEALLEAKGLTWDMIDFMSDFVEDDPAGAEFTEWWWLDQIEKARGKEEAEEVRKTWDNAVAAGRAKPAPEVGFKDKLEAALAKPKPQPEAGAEPKPEPEGAPKAGLPAVVTAPPLAPQPTLDDALALMNSRHAVLNDVGGKTVIGCWEEGDNGYFKLAFHGLDSFRLRYSNTTVTTDVPDGRGGVRLNTVDLAKWWLDHRNRAQYRGVKFRPNREGVVSGYLNLWRGWGVEASPGDWSLIQQHIVDVIAGGNAEFAEYVLRWIAWAIQNPDKQAEVALVLIGEKGSGKGTVARCLKPIFGSHAMQVTDREQVIGQFNGHLEDCILFIADEAYWGGDKRCIGRLQGMITEEELPIRRMYCETYQAKNYLHILMLAEPGWVIPAGKFERRYAAFSVDDRYRGDRGYFKALNRQMAGGGIPAMVYDLLRVELGDWHPREIPDALLRGGALTQQQALSLPPWEQWYLSLLLDGKLPEASNKKPNTAYTHALLDNIKERVPRLKFDASDYSLRVFMLKMGCTKYHGSLGNGWSFAPLAIARAAWDAAYGPQGWDNPDGEWTK